MSVETQVIKDDSLRYDSEEIYYGNYKLIQVYPDEGTNGQTVDTGGGVAHTIPIGSQYVVNLAQSFLNLQVVLPSTAVTNFNWTYADVAGMIRDLALQPESGQYLYQLMDAPVFQKLTNRPLTQYEEFKTIDTDWVDTTDGFRRSADQPFYPSHKEQSRNKLPSNGQDAALPYDLPQYCYQSNRIRTGAADNNPATAFISFRIPLKYFKGILAVNKDLYFGQQCNLVITYEGLTKWLWNSTSATDPSAGAGASSAASVNIQAFLDLAVEQDQEIIMQLKSKVMSEGMQMLIPYVQRIYKNSLEGTSQNISNVTLNRGHGLRLLRLWYGIFNGTQTYDDYLDNNNLATNTTAVSGKSKVDTLQTFMDGVPLQVKALNSGGVPNSTQSNADDYKYLKNRLRGSCVQSMIDYYQNWFWCDDWTQPMSKSQEEKDLPLANKLQGFRLDDGAQHTWQINMITKTGPYFHYVFIETLRVLKLAPGVISLV